MSCERYEAFGAKTVSPACGSVRFSRLPHKTVAWSVTIYHHLPLLKETTDWLDKPPENNPKRKNSDQLAWTERVQIDQLRRELVELLKDQAP
jgi:hypothetical protein